MKINIQALVRSIVVIVVLGAALMLLQMWFSPFSQAVFWKLLASLVILGGLITFIIAVKEDMSSCKKLKDDKYID